MRPTRYFLVYGSIVLRFESTVAGGRTSSSVPFNSSTGTFFSSAGGKLGSKKSCRKAASPCSRSLAGSKSEYHSRKACSVIAAVLSAIGASSVLLKRGSDCAAFHHLALVSGSMFLV